MSSLRAPGVAAVAAALCFAVPSMASEVVGQAVLIKTKVTGQSGPLSVKEPVHRDERISTSASGLGQFLFRDGTKLDKAFTYDWRFWSLRELREILEEAGFRDIRVYWDTSDDEDHENYVPKARADNQPGWLAYLVAS